MTLMFSACGDSKGDKAPDLTGYAVHYHRGDGDYAGWKLERTVGGEAQVQAADGVDGFGAVFLVKPEGAAKLRLLGPDGAADPLGQVEAQLEASGAGLWLFSGHDQVFDHAPPALPKPDQAVVYYLRADGEYAGWGLHTWEDVAVPTGWKGPLEPKGSDPAYGAYFLVNLKPEAARVNVIVHKGDEKDPGPDMGFDVSSHGRLVWVVSGDATVYAHPMPPTAFNLANAQAHWIGPRLLAWSPAEAPASASVALLSSAEGQLVATSTAVYGGQRITAKALSRELSPAELARFPYLKGVKLYELEGSEATLKAALKTQLVAVAEDKGAPVDATRVQLAGVLDALYTFEGWLGAKLSGDKLGFRLWAPTARAVRLLRFDASKKQQAAVSLTQDDKGVWSTEQDKAAWLGQFYQYEVEVYHPAQKKVVKSLVTDPYSVSLSADGFYSQAIDLSDPSTQPTGWGAFTPPKQAAPEDIVIYETHVRDFSVWDQTVPAGHRGKFLGFTHPGSAGMKHLKALADAGLTTVHLLPAFDFATVKERAADRVELTSGFEDLCAATEVPAALCTQHKGRTVQEALQACDPTTKQAQTIYSYLRGLDGFNWGYDPFHYTVPEGSYATDPEGPARIKELRQAIQALGGLGLNVALDVVYNHTNAAGLADYSVLDKIVPNYYHRLNTQTGGIENSTCCQNTASENAMMEKLMIDSLVTWATQYKLKAFRFDLMGHHMRANMEKVKTTLAALTEAADGVDGASIYLYGEGWDFGEVQGNKRGKNATQLNMGGAGIGTFNDRLRDAARGGGPFDSAEALRKNQGFINGQYTHPNELAAQDAATKEALLDGMRLIRLGLAATLKEFKMVITNGAVMSGKTMGYNGAQAAYAEDPQEVINYVSKHDNQTLWDINQYKLPTGTSAADRLRSQMLGLDLVALAQGVPFFHLGSDMLRSKSMERDSYDSGDWYNRVDFSYQDNNWNKGLPREDKDGGNYAVIQDILKDGSIKAGEAEIKAASQHLIELLKIRSQSPLFRLRTAADVQKRVDFHNVGPTQLPGVILMTITDGTCAGPDLDPNADAIVVIFNARPDEVRLPLTGATNFTLHPVQQASADPVVKTAKFNAPTFLVPARTTAVFTQPQSTTQGPGLPCNPH